MGEFHVSDGATPFYNCLAWALGRTDKWLWPQTDTLEAMDRVMQRSAFARRAAAQENEAAAVIALYCRGEVPTHVALALGGEWWESKLGRGPRIVHRLRAVEGEQYGTVRWFYARLKERK